MILSSGRPEKYRPNPSFRTSVRCVKKPSESLVPALIGGKVCINWS